MPQTLCGSLPPRRLPLPIRPHLIGDAPERLDLEQTHLYAAMDFAHTTSSLDWMLRIDRLLTKLE